MRFIGNFSKYLLDAGVGYAGIPFAQTAVVMVNYLVGVMMQLLLHDKFIFADKIAMVVFNLIEYQPRQANGIAEL